MIADMGWAWLYAGIVMVAVGIVIGAFIEAWKLIAAVYERRIARELDELETALPNHKPGRIRRSRGVKRKLHRDLVLFLVVNSDHEDA